MSGQKNKRRHNKHNSCTKCERHRKCYFCERDYIPITGFQGDKRHTLGTCCPPNHIINPLNKLGYYSTVDMYFTQLYNSFSDNNHHKSYDPNLRYRARLAPITHSSRELCHGLCQKCLPKN